MRYLGQEDEGFLQRGWTVWFGNISDVDFSSLGFCPQNKAPHFDDAREAVLALWDLFKTNPDLDCWTSIFHEGGKLVEALYFRNRQEVQDAAKEYL